MQKTLIGALGGALAALALAGCNNNPPATPPTTSTTTVTTPAPTAATTTTTANGTAATSTAVTPGVKINNNAGPGTSNGTDTQTADAVNTAIVRNKEMTGSRVDVVVTGGVARLTGTVQDQQQKALAATTASKVPGVSSVVNKLIIDATGGAHSASAAPKTKVIKKTTVINRYIGVPSGGSGASSGGMGGASSSASSGAGGASSSASGGMGTAPGNGAGGNGGNGNGAGGNGANGNGAGGNGNGGAGTGNP